MCVTGVSCMSVWRAAGSNCEHASTYNSKSPHTNAYLHVQPRKEEGVRAKAVSFSSWPPDYDYVDKVYLALLPNPTCTPGRLKIFHPICLVHSLWTRRSSKSSTSVFTLHVCAFGYVHTCVYLCACAHVCMHQFELKGCSCQGPGQGTICVWWTEVPRVQRGDGRRWWTMPSPGHLSPCTHETFSGGPSCDITPRKHCPS